MAVTPPSTPPQQNPYFQQGISPPGRKSLRNEPWRQELEHWTEASPTPQERQSRVLCAEMIADFYRRPVDLLDLSGYGLTSLPDLFNDLVFRQNIKVLNLSRNNLESLPTTFCHLTCLEELDLNENPSLRRLPEQIGDLKNLKSLSMLQMSEELLDPIVFPESFSLLSKLTSISISGYNYETIPQPIVALENLKRFVMTGCSLTSIEDLCLSCTHLVTFDVSHNQIEEIPESIMHLGEAETIDLSANPFVRITNALFNLPPDAQVVMRNSMLSEDQMDIIRHTIQTEDYAGPKFTISSKKDITLRVMEKIQAIKQAMEDEEEFVLPEFLKDKENAQQLYTWLKRLTDTAKPTEVSYQPIFAAALALIGCAAECEAFREIFLEKLPEAGLTCGDRVILSIMNMELEKKRIEIDPEDVPSHIRFFKEGFYVMHLLEQQAYKKIETFKEEGTEYDDVEVLLAYPIKLKERLELPFSIDRMFFYHVSNITEQDLEEAYEEVQQKLSDNEEFVNFLLGGRAHFWQDFVIKHRKEEFEALNERIAEAEYDQCERIRYEGFRALTLSLIPMLKREADAEPEEEPDSKRLREV